LKGKSLYMKRFSIAALFLWAVSSTATAQSNDEIELLKQQVQQLSSTVEQIRTNQLVIARQLGLIKPEQIMPGEPAPISTGHTVGQVNAKVVIMEFTDLQCPFCQTFNTEVYPKIKETYIDTGKVLFVNRQNPITRHPQARKGAHYLLCSIAQGKYDEVKNDLFRFGGKLQDGEFGEIPAIASLDQAQLKTCLSKEVELNRQIDSDIQLGKMMGVAATPTFMIGLQNENGQLVDWARYEGAKPFEFYQEIIETLLAKD